MNYLKKGLFIGVMSGLFLSCADESPWKEDNSTSSAKGGIKLSLTSSNEIANAIPKVRATSEHIVAPPVSDFQIRLAKVDGSYIRTWSSLKDFVAETEFPVGVYELEATYGDKNSQGAVKSNEVGYEHSYYYGKVENITVLEDKDTEVSLSAKLANAVVKVDYTDAYRRYFTSWNTTLQTSSPENVVLGGEAGICYVVAPGEVDIIMDAVLQNGKTVFLNPAKFTVEPQHQYNITYNINNGEVGDVSELEITFSDDVDVEVITIELTDDLVNTDAPVITAVGFVGQDVIETQVGVPLLDKKIQYEVVAHGKIKSAVLNVKPENAQTVPASFLTNGSIDLCEADESKQSEMSSKGIDARGFFSNPDKFAFIDLTEFCKNLPAGIFTISLKVVDIYDQTNDPEETAVTIVTVDTNSDIKSAKTIFGDGFADLEIEYDGPDPTVKGANPFSFGIISPVTGKEFPVNIISCGTDISAMTRAEYVKKTYFYRVSMPEEESDSYKVSMYFNGSSAPVVEKYPFDVTYPAYEVEYDAFAKWMRLRVANLESDASKRELYTKRLRVFVDGFERTDLEKDYSTGIVSFKGLTKNTPYNLKTSLQLKETPDVYNGVSTITTEPETEVPNGDFEELTQYFSGEIKQGGTWSTSSVDVSNYQNTSTFTISIANLWSTSNDNTMGGSNTNSWFYQPSVFNSTLSYTGKCPGVGLSTGSASGTPASYSGFKVHSKNNSMVIRNVAWDPIGTNIGKDNDGGSGFMGAKATSEYFNKYPPVIANVSAGKMFLGTYPQSELLKDAEGYSFDSRPLRLKGWYTYKRDESSNQDDYGIVSIIIYSGENAIVQRSATLEATDEMKSFTIDLDSYPFQQKATKIAVMVTSSKFASSSQEYETQNIAVTPYVSKIESYKHGATLVVDDFQFEY